MSHLARRGICLLCCHPLAWGLSWYPPFPLRHTIPCSFPCQKHLLSCFSQCLSDWRGIKEGEKKKNLNPISECLQHFLVIYDFLRILCKREGYNPEVIILWLKIWGSQPLKCSILAVADSSQLCVVQQPTCSQVHTWTAESRLSYAHHTLKNMNISVIILYWLCVTRIFLMCLGCLHYFF